MILNDNVITTEIRVNDGKASIVCVYKDRTLKRVCTTSLTTSENHLAIAKIMKDKLEMRGDLVGAKFGRKVVWIEIKPNGENIA